MTYFDDGGTWGECSPNLVPQPEDMVRSGAFSHAACMVRKEAYLAVGGYTVDDKYLRVEDYDLWVKKYAKGYRGRNIDEALYHMRDDRAAMARRSFRNRLDEARVSRKAIRLLKLPKWYYLCSMRPILIGLLPDFLYRYLHRKRLKKTVG